MKETLMECITTAGQILLQRFGQGGEVRRKGNLSNIVTDADLASEAHLLRLIEARYPGHNILAEESGWMDRGSAWTWVIDPLDGTSNFAAGLPWFGVMVAVFEETRPVMGAMCVPCSGDVYFAEAGQGAWRNGQAVRVTGQTELGELLCAYAMDHAADDELARRRAMLLVHLLSRVRNTRCTNSLVDFAYTIDGRLGAFLNHNAKIWDIAAAWLILAEAGGRMTDLRGKEIQFTLGPAASDREYSVLGTSLALLPDLVELVAGSGFWDGP